ncbi:MAG: hypothetical protein NC308_00535 [Clostridium sp.]|nr:hypothetical protein [Bacteroides sp.]MCM1197351.1 hypothetical protein [Clostridium sp.]
MKKTVLLPFAAAAAALASCQQEPMAQDEKLIDDLNLTEKLFVADFGPQTRAELADGYRVKWTEGDVVAIYGANKVEVTAEIDPSDEYRASFRAAGIAEAPGYYAVYPADGAVSCTDGELAVELPAVQTAVAGSFDKSAVIAAAYTDGQESGDGLSLTFRNLCGLVGFNVPADDVVSVEISSLGNDAISGEAKAVFDESGFPVVTPGEKSSSSVVVNGDFEKGQTYYASVFPCSCPEGMSISYTFGSGKTMEYNIHKSQALPARSKVRKIEVSEGFSADVLSAATSFTVAGTKLVTDYDSNVFAKQNVRAGALADNNGTNILTVPFSAARVVVDKQSGTVDVYDSANDLSAWSVEFYMNNLAANGKLKTTITDRIWLYGDDRWSTVEFAAVPSESDPQILTMTYSGGYLKRFNFKTGKEITDFEILEAGTLTASPKDVYTQIYTLAPEDQSLIIPINGGSNKAAPIEIGKWTKISGGSAWQRGSYFYPVDGVNEDGSPKFIFTTVKYIIVDLRNMRIKLIK